MLNNTHDTENRNVFGIFLGNGIDSIDKMCYNRVTKIRKWGIKNENGYCGK